MGSSVDPQGRGLNPQVVSKPSKMNWKKFHYAPDPFELDDALGKKQPTPSRIVCVRIADLWHHTIEQAAAAKDAAAKAAAAAEKAAAVETAAEKAAVEGAAAEKAAEQKVSWRKRWLPGSTCWVSACGRKPGGAGGEGPGVQRAVSVGRVRAVDVSWGGEIGDGYCVG